MKLMDSVCILLSTYNGELYLSELLDSLLSQDYNRLLIIIRDDGSVDDTVSILRRYKSHHLNKIKLILGENLGVIRSFFELLKYIPEDCQYVGFCDQDDVWKNIKVSRAISCLSNIKNIPVAYFSAFELVNSQLAHIGFSSKPRVISFPNALVENIITGCATFLNREAVELLKSKIPDYSKILMHDMWVYLTISAFGQIVFDPVSTILYRQHSSNTVGSRSGYRQFLHRLKRFYKKQNKNKLLQQALEFDRLFSDVLPINNKVMLKQFLNASLKKRFVHRIIYAFTTPLKRQKRFDEIILKILIIFKMI